MTSRRVAVWFTEDTWVSSSINATAALVGADPATEVALLYVVDSRVGGGGARRARWSLGRG